MHKHFVCKTFWGQTYWVHKCFECINILDAKLFWMQTIYNAQNILNANILNANHFECKPFWVKTILNANYFECDLFWMQTILIANHFECKTLHIVCTGRFRRGKKAMYIWGICKGQSVLDYFCDFQNHFYRK